MSQELNGPNYIVDNDVNTTPLQRALLRTPAENVSFPLSAEDLVDLEVLEQKHDLSDGIISGLAAPQIGINKRIIIFSLTGSEHLKTVRPDFEQTMSKSIWINPTYKPLSNELHADYEVCFSVQGLSAKTNRFVHIEYNAFLADGTEVSGQASGFLARLIQHEIDHVNGILYTDKAELNSAITIEEFVERFEPKSE